MMFHEIFLNGKQILKNVKNNCKCFKKNIELLQTLQCKGF